MDPIQTICICGAGTMGCGIAQVSASAGFYTILYDLDETVLEKAKSTIIKNLEDQAEKGKISVQGKQAVFQNMHYTNDLLECLGEIAIEAIVENSASKIALFNQLAEINSSVTIFASNTSSLSVEQIAKGVKSPERVIGMHFFNPAPLMKLVEVVDTNYTNEKTRQTIIELAKKMGKTPVICKDSPGFIVNRVARPYYIESLHLVEMDIADFSSIDTLMEATGFKMGPFKLMDLIGNDINYAVSRSVYDQLGKPERLRPSSIQKEKVEKLELGKKTGRGYYNYS